MPDRLDRLALYGALEAWAQQAQEGRWPPVPRRLEDLRFLLARDLTG